MSMKQLDYHTSLMLNIYLILIVECKGRFTSEDRRKMRLVKEQHPDLDIRFVFSRSSSKINKGSKTTYADWCHKYGFPFADKLIPEIWLGE